MKKISGIDADKHMCLNYTEQQETTEKARNTKDIETQNAIIESTSIEIDDHGCLSIWLHLAYAGAGKDLVAIGCTLQEMQRRFLEITLVILCGAC